MSWLHRSKAEAMTTTPALVVSHSLGSGTTSLGGQLLSEEQPYSSRKAVMSNGFGELDVEQALGSNRISAPGLSGLFFQMSHQHRAEDHESLESLVGRMVVSRRALSLLSHTRKS